MLIQETNNQLPDWLQIDENAKYNGEDIDTELERLYKKTKKDEDELPAWTKEPIESVETYTKKLNQRRIEYKEIDKMTNKNVMIDMIESKPDLYTWGTPILDKLFAPIERNHLIVLTAKAGSGKSTYTFDMAEKNTRLGKRVLYITLEMGVKKFIQLKAIRTAGITKMQWRERNFTERQVDKYVQTKARIYDNNKLIFGSFADSNMEQNCENIAKMINTIGPDLVIIDNFNLISKIPHEKDLDAENRISKFFMDYTNENETPVMLIHHTNKNGEMRGSQKIEDNSDIHIFMKREYDELATEEEKHATKLIIKKDRDWGDLLSNIIYFNSGSFDDTYMSNNNFNVSKKPFYDKI